MKHKKPKGDQLKPLFDFGEASRSDFEKLIKMLKTSRTIQISSACKKLAAKIRKD